MKIVPLVVALSTLLGSVKGFTAHHTPCSRRPTTSIEMERRDFHHALLTALGGIIAIPSVASAKAASTFFFDDDLVKEPAQQYTGGKMDVNAAFVVSKLLSE